MANFTTAGSGTPESPFGWYYDLLAIWAHVSTASIWMRLPTLLMAIACWWLISREVIPRLGRPVQEASRAAVWTAAGMFLAVWLPLEQRPASRADHRPGHPSPGVRVGAGGHQPSAAGGGGLHRRRAHAVLRPTGIASIGALPIWPSGRCARSHAAGRDGSA